MYSKKGKDIQNLQAILICGFAIYVKMTGLKVHEKMKTYLHIGKIWIINITPFY